MKWSQYQVGVSLLCNALSQQPCISNIFLFLTANTASQEPQYKLHTTSDRLQNKILLASVELSLLHGSLGEKKKKKNTQNTSLNEKATVRTLKHLIDFTIKVKLFHVILAFFFHATI